MFLWKRQLLNEQGINEMSSSSGFPIITPSNLQSPSHPWRGPLLILGRELELRDLKWIILEESGLRPFQA